ncbi:MAG: hypothetical protein K8F91_22400 [Candidatus Obscuribacterales bacterium]|nr:hypothetical protein [Candidatus Obscuribacterales bacterium]
MDDSTQKTTFRPGQSFLCRIAAAEPGGYSAKLIPSEMDAFLPSRDDLEIGESVPATFVCMSNNRALMTFAFVVGTTERVQFGLPSDQETAFAIWSDSYPSNVKLRRAVDVIMPQVTGKLASAIRCGDLKLAQLLSDLETSKFTGSIKAESEKVLSRSAALVFDGRVVGCIYGRRSLQEAHLGDRALEFMLEDLQLDGTTMQIYELPREIVLSMSALFIGCPVDEKIARQQEASDFAQSVVDSLSNSLETACIALSTDERQSQCLAFLYKGEKHGSFSVIDQVFDENFDLIFKKACEIPEVKANAYLLPREMISDSVLLGYSFSGRLPVTDS